MDKNILSIVMVCYNHGPYLKEALESVLAQTYQDWELIIVDDGSVDDSVEISAGYARRFSSKIRLVRHPGNQNQGIRASYLAGISLAKGDFLGFLEGDDLWEANNAEKKIQVLLENEAGLVYSAVKPFGNPEFIQKRKNYLKNTMVLPRLAPFRAGLWIWAFNFIPTFSTVIFRRNLLRQDRDLVENKDYCVWLDWFLWLRLSGRTKFYFIPDELVIWRMHAQSYGTRTVSSSGRVNELLFQLRYRLFLLKDLFGGRTYKPARRKKIIDIGCGEGLNAYLLSKSHDVVGIDMSGDNIALARKKYPGVEFRVMNGEHLEFSDNYFDRICAMDVIEHVDHLDPVIGEAWRVLKPGGELIVNIPYWKSEQWLLKIRPTYFDEIHHVRIFGENELEKMLVGEKFCLARKKRQGFLSHIFFFYIFKSKSVEKNQLSIGDMRYNWFSKAVFAGVTLFDLSLFRTPLKYIPLWIVTLPVGLVINFFGNMFFPKSLFYKFVKNA
jgi:glycosyltransferase involved in cell wall biosynthesis